MDKGSELAPGPLLSPLSAPLTLTAPQNQLRAEQGPRAPTHSPCLQGGHRGGHRRVSSDQPDRALNASHEGASLDMWLSGRLPRGGSTRPAKGGGWAQAGVTPAGQAAPREQSRRPGEEGGWRCTGRGPKRVFTPRQGGVGRQLGVKRRRPGSAGRGSRDPGEKPPPSPLGDGPGLGTVRQLREEDQGGDRGAWAPGHPN